MDSTLPGGHPGSGPWWWLGSRGVSSKPSMQEALPLSLALGSAHAASSQPPASAPTKVCSVPSDSHEDNASRHVQAADGPGAARLHLTAAARGGMHGGLSSSWLCFSCCIPVSTETFPSRAQHSVLHRKRRIRKDLFTLSDLLFFFFFFKYQGRFVCTPLRMESSQHPPGTNPGPSWRAFWVCPGVSCHCLRGNPPFPRGADLLEGAPRAVKQLIQQCLKPSC